MILLGVSEGHTHPHVLVYVSGRPPMTPNALPNTRTRCLCTKYGFPSLMTRFEAVLDTGRAHQLTYITSPTYDQSMTKILCRVLYSLESSSAQMSSAPLHQAQGAVPSAQATCSSVGKCVGGHGRSPRDILHQYVWVCVTLTYPYQNHDFGSWGPRGCSGGAKTHRI